MKLRGPSEIVYLSTPAKGLPLRVLGEFFFCADLSLVVPCLTPSLDPSHGILCMWALAVPGTAEIPKMGNVLHIRGQ